MSDAPDQPSVATTEPAGSSFRHEVVVTPSFYLVRDEPSKNYGVGNCRIVFYAIGEKGAVQFMLGTDWAIEKVRAHLSNFPRHRRDDVQPQAWDIGYHSRVPMYDGQSPMERRCDVLGATCYYDGSSLQAEDWVEGFCAGGTEWLWPRLEQYYRFTFEDGTHPDLTPEYRQHPDDRPKVSQDEPAKRT